MPPPSSTAVAPTATSPPSAPSRGPSRCSTSSVPRPRTRTRFPLLTSPRQPSRWDPGACRRCHGTTTPPRRALRRRRPRTSSTTACSRSTPPPPPTASTRREGHRRARAQPRTGWTWTGPRCLVVLARAHVPALHGGKKNGGGIFNAAGPSYTVLSFFEWVKNVTVCHYVLPELRHGPELQYEGRPSGSCRHGGRVLPTATGALGVPGGASSGRHGAGVPVLPLPVPRLALAGPGRPRRALPPPGLRRRRRLLQAHRRGHSQSSGVERVTGCS
uniref:Uncharacterized protein n=1 Tax=Zea mays TaxID=4577 RepID=C0P3Q6_MAIZE|nr:unknown [Zea mays]